MIKLKISEPPKLRIGCPGSDQVHFSADSYIKTAAASDFYNGEYEVDPRFAGQILQTTDKYMLQDVVVNAIYVARTTNLQGGNTVYIGGEFING